MKELFLISFKAHLQYVYNKGFKSQPDATQAAETYILKQLEEVSSGFMVWQILLYHTNRFKNLQDLKPRDFYVKEFLKTGVDVIESLIVRFGEVEFEDILKNYKENNK